MRFVIKAVSAVAGFLLGLVVSIFFMFLIQIALGAPVRPRLPPGVLIGAIVCAIAAWRSAPAPETVRAWFNSPFAWLRSTEAKLTIAFAVPWMLSVGLATYAFRLFRGYDAAPRYYALLLAPPLIFLLAMVLRRWALRTKAERADAERIENRTLSADAR